MPESKKSSIVGYIQIKKNLRGQSNNLGKGRVMFTEGQ